MRDLNVFFSDSVWIGVSIGFSLTEKRCVDEGFSDLRAGYGLPRKMKIEIRRNDRDLFSNRGFPLNGIDWGMFRSMFCGTKRGFFGIQLRSERFDFDFLKGLLCLWRDISLIEYFDVDCRINLRLRFDFDCFSYGLFL